MQNTNKLKEKKLLQNLIVRKRINIANFYKKNIINENFDYLICIPVNGFTSDKIQIIRTDLNKYGFQVSKYTRKLFDLLLKKSDININTFSEFYLGQMLIIKINLINDNYRKKQKQQHEIIKFLDIYLSKIKYSNLIYNGLYLNKSKLNLNINININNFIVVRSFDGNLSKDFTDILDNNSKNVHNFFLNFNNNIFEFFAILHSKKILLLNLLLFIANDSKNIKKNNEI